MQGRCMTLVGSDGKALKGEYLKTAEAAIAEAKAAGLKIWINSKGYFYQRKNSIFSISEPLIDKSGMKVRMCSAPLKGNSNICETCGGSCPGHMRKCSCGEMIGADMGFCPYCGIKQLERKIYHFSDGYWTGEEDIFSEYFNYKEVGPLLRDGLNIRENQSCIVLCSGAVNAVLSSGKHVLSDLIGNDNISSCSLVMVEKSEKSLPINVKNVETSDAVAVDFRAEILFRFDPDKAVNFAQELAGNSLYLQSDSISNSLCYDEILQRVQTDFATAVKDCCRKISAAELCSDAEQRIQLAKNIKTIVAEYFDSLGLHYIRLKGMDFSSEAFEQIRAKHIEIETKRKELEFKLELDELAYQEDKQQKLSEKEMQDFVAQLAHEKGISDEMHQQELEELRIRWKRQQELEDVEHQNTMNDVKAQAENARKLEEVDVEQQIIDTEHAHELERRKKEYHAMLENAKIKQQIADIEATIQEKKRIAEKKALETYIDIREQKNSAKKIFASNDSSIDVTIQRERDVEKRDALQELNVLYTRSAKYPEIFLSAAAMRGDQRAKSALNKLPAKQITDIDHLKAENIDLYDQLIALSDSRFLGLKDLLMDEFRRGGNIAGVNVAAIFSGNSGMETVYDMDCPVSECPYLDVAYNRNLFLLRNASAVMNLRLTPKIDKPELSIFLVKERNGVRSRREIDIQKIFKKGKQTILDIPLSPGNIYGTLMISIYIGVKIKGKFEYYSASISPAVYDSQQTSANLNLTIENTINASGAADVNYQAGISSILEDLKKSNASVNDMISRLNELPPKYQDLILEETRWCPEDYLIHGSRYQGNKLRLKWKEHSLVLFGMKSMELGRNRKKVNLVIRTTDDKLNQTVSRHHATVSADKNAAYITDVSSSGTWLNGKKLGASDRQEVTTENSVVQFGDVCWNMHMQLCEPSCRNVCQSCDKDKVKCLTFDRRDGVKEKYLMICQCCDLGRVLPELENWDVFFRDGSFFIRDPHGDFFHLSPGSTVEASGQKIGVTIFEE